jgi:4-amino-4-deoxy-L-arabinose transferase-like glycosyltransferase
MTHSEQQESISSQRNMVIVVAVLALISSGIGLMTGGSPFIAMGIAAIQVFIVLYFLMHMKSEKIAMHGLTALCAFLIVFLLLATIVTYTNIIDGTEKLDYIDSTPVAEEAH